MWVEEDGWKWIEEEREEERDGREEEEGEEGEEEGEKEPKKRVRGDATIEFEGEVE